MPKIAPQINTFNGLANSRAFAVEGAGNKRKNKVKGI